MLLTLLLQRVYLDDALVGGVVGIVGSGLLYGSGAPVDHCAVVAEIVPRVVVEGDGVVLYRGVAAGKPHHVNLPVTVYHRTAVLEPLQSKHKFPGMHCQGIPGICRDPRLQRIGGVRIGGIKLLMNHLRMRIMVRLQFHTGSRIDIICVAQSANFFLYYHINNLGLQLNLSWNLSVKDNNPA